MKRSVRHLADSICMRAATSHMHAAHWSSNSGQGADKSGIFGKKHVHVCHANATYIITSRKVLLSDPRPEPQPEGRAAGGFYRGLPARTTSPCATSHSAAPPSRAPMATQRPQRDQARQVTANKP